MTRPTSGRSRRVWPVRLLRALLATLGLAALPTALAHLTEVNLTVLEQSGRLVLLAGSVEGYPINGAKVEYILTDAAGRVLRAPMRETGNGEYTAPLPAAKSGAYTLVVRDTTFPQEALEATAKVTWPLKASVALVLPPSTAGGPSLFTLFVMLALPIMAALAVLAWAILKRPKPEAQGAESSAP